MSKQSARGYGRLLVLGGILAVAAAAIIWLSWGPRTTSAPLQPTTPPLPPYAATKFLNARPEARYIGIDACAACHKPNHQSYLLTAHSRALSDLDPSAEPADGSFFHKPSGRTYRVYRQGNQLRQEETLRTEEGKEIARMDLPVRYLIGSGHFTRSYLVEVDGFLHESPISWYASRKDWGMSPGYDFPKHWGWERPAQHGCVACHAGRVEASSDSVRLRIHEQAIGCESCHGPGSLHAERYRPGAPAPQGSDFTIVNPGKLSRELLESVCAACHLSSGATVLLRGRQAGDFRPGQPLEDYRIDYRLDTGNDRMTVVGHMDQLRQSACYQKSKDLNCLTCHDPHARTKPADPVAFYRQKCLNCHAEQACGLKKEQRVAKAGSDNCTACHMPTGNTDIPHVAFAHHRIGRHADSQSLPVERTPELVPMSDVSRLPELDRQRNLGIAYASMLNSPQYAKHFDLFRTRARQLLEPTYAAGLRDGMVTHSLARAYWPAEPVRVGAFAQQALDAKDLPAEHRATALLMRADAYLKEGQRGSGIKTMEELVKVRRFAEDWRVLGNLYLEQGQPEKAREALETALAMRPYRYDIHGALAEAYRQLGDAGRAGDHLAKAKWLHEHKQE